jgi:hypothetical protein
MKKFRKIGSVGLRTNNSFHITLLVRRTKFICRSTCRYANMPNSVFKHGLPYEQVMRITGHKKLSTLQKYIKSDSNIEQMLEVGRKIRKH